jgi:uncharacterized membrane protein YcaP (DUF421 family)
MFDLQVPGWELVARAIAIYAVLLVMVRVSGKRTVGQFTPFDLLVVMLLSESVSNALSAGDDSLAAGLILAATLMGLNAVISRVTARSARMRVLAEGEAVVVGRNGKVLQDRLRAEHVSEEELMQALREADCDVEDMKVALLEADGKFSILKDATRTACKIAGA